MAKHKKEELKMDAKVEVEVKKDERIVINEGDVLVPNVKNPIRVHRTIITEDYKVTEADSKDSSFCKRAIFCIKADLLKKA